MNLKSSPRRSDWVLAGVFGVALVSHFVMTTQNWTVPFMAGQEFRQAQTAIVSHYIEEQNNFSVLYETPILGKPWVSILMEVPVYEWSVVGLSRLTGWPHYVSARTISLHCFYLTLPALYLLLGRLHLPKPRRLLVLALILACPVYIYYSRAFLMESMELMCCAWFLLAFVRTMDRRQWAWLFFSWVAGVGAILIKGSTLAVWLLPAVGYGVWLLYGDVKRMDGKAVGWTALWGLATIGPALGALQWWVKLTDPLKEAHASAWIFTSKTLSQGNWGLTDLAARFSPQVWGTLAERWSEAIMPPLIIGACLVGGLFVQGIARRWVLGLGAVFFGAQILFPFAYAYQDYYFYACAVFLLGALGYLCHGVLESRLPRWICGLVIAVPLLAQVSTYWLGYRTQQMVVSQGGFYYTDLIRTVTPRDSVLVVAGFDWAAMVPFYAKRKALMIRNGLEGDPVYLQRAFEDLHDENVSAVLLVGPTRKNQALLARATEMFSLEKEPTCSWPDVDIYFSRPYAEAVRVHLRTSNQYPGVKYTPTVAVEAATNVPFAISPGMARASFANITPAPFQGFFSFGVDHMEFNGGSVLGAHPDCDLWIHAPAEAAAIEVEYGLLPQAYEREGDKTNGIELIITGEGTDGSKRVIFQRLLDPANEPKDRGLQQEKIAYAPLPGEDLRFSIRPHHSAAFDWAYWTRIEVK